ncbi:DB module [Ancylostoma ceylanicum]|uniref:DB module n=1 Tax=Ancylostoma ceylanicum TaxID=53326 RepID=A0A0D6LAC7_9BILA|nr:DB module [Ancylostoma ceylanicum]
MQLLVASILAVPVLACFPDIDNLPPPIIHSECLKRGTSCPSWYRCGGSDCNSARKIHGVSSRLQNVPIINSQRHIVSSIEIANALFAACCRRSDIPEQCMPACDYDRYNSQLDGIFISEEHGTTPPPDSREVDLEERNIFGISRGAGKPAKAQSIESRERPDNVTIHRLTNPNFIFRQCCEQRGLPDACLDKCHFNSYTRNALQAMYFKTDRCPIEATADMHFCAAQGRDHTENNKTGLLLCSML